MSQELSDALVSERLSRAISLVVLAFVAAMAWWLLGASAATMHTMAGEGLLLRAAIAMMRPDHAGPYFIVSSLMWLLMMIAMMTPVVLPVLMTLQRMRTDIGNRASVMFALGYLAVWGGFGVLLTLVQWGLHEASHLHGMELAANPMPAALILVGAGLYQLTPLKRACLAHCQSPLAFLLGHWRAGIRGAWLMGLDHGRYCLGCCWALMLVMFVGGVMSVATMAVLSLFVLAERVLPAGLWASTVPGVAMIAGGVVLLSIA